MITLYKTIHSRTIVKSIKIKTTNLELKLAFTPGKNKSKKASIIFFIKNFKKFKNKKQKCTTDAIIQVEQFKY